MEISLNILVILTWIIFAVVSGYTEAAYWYYRNKVKVNFKIDWYDHEGWTIMRAALAIVSIALLWEFYNWATLMLVYTLPMVFPFFHDGSYYYYRNSIDGSYPKGWFDTSVTSTAKITADTRTRIIMLILGIVSYISMILISKGI